MPQVAPTDAEAATGTKSAQPSAIEDDTDEAVSQAILKQSEMSEQMQAAAIEVAAKAVAKGGWDNEIAARIKKEMDKKFQSLSRGAWHCIVGPDFGSYVTHEAKHFIYFYLPRGLSPQEKAKGGASAQGQQKMVRPPPRPAARAARPAARAPPMFCSRRTAPRAPPMFRSRRTRRALPAGWRAALPHVACKKKLQILDSVHFNRRCACCVSRRLPTPRPTLERKHTIQKEDMGRGPRSFCAARGCGLARSCILRKVVDAVRDVGKSCVGAAAQ